jgi:hypothetical protein
MSHNKAETAHEKSSKIASLLEKAPRLSQVEVFVITLLMILSLPTLGPVAAQEIIDRMRNLYSENFEDPDRNWERLDARNDDIRIRSGELQLNGLGFEDINFVRIPDRFTNRALRFSFTLADIPQAEEGYAVAEIRVQRNPFNDNTNDGILSYEAIRLFVNQGSTYVTLIRNDEESQVQTIDTSDIVLDTTYTLVYLPPELFGEGVQLGQLQVMNGSLLLFTHPVKLNAGTRNAYIGALANTEARIDVERVEISRP